MLDGFEDKTAYAQCIISFMSEELNEPIAFVGQTNVNLFRNETMLTHLSYIRARLLSLEEKRNLPGIRFSSLMVSTERNS